MVTETTIRRDAAYASAVEAIAEAVGRRPGRPFWRGRPKSPSTRSRSWPLLPRSVRRRPRLTAVQAARTPKAVKQMVQAASGGAGEIAQVGDGNLAEAGVPREALARFASTQGAPEVLALEAEATAVDGPPVELHRNRWGSVTEPPTAAPPLSSA